jgi:3-oxoacyl-[acyl-carrier-protein] synthase-3
MSAASELVEAIEIDASADRVWDALTDFERYPAWNPFIRQAHGELAVGGRIDVAVRPSLGVPLHFHATVLACEPKRALVWRGDLGGAWLAGGEHAFELEPLGADRVRFVQREVFSGAVPRLLRRLLEHEARRGFRAMNEALAARVRRPRGTWMLVEPAGPLPTRLEAVGVALPGRHVSTRELMAGTRHHTRIDLERLTGIREHREAGRGEESLDLAIAAARDCLARSRYAAADLDMVIGASITRYVDPGVHRFEPPLAVSLKAAIGAHDAIGFDVSNACAGMLTGVFLLHDLVRRGVIRRGMVASGEHITGLGANAARSIRSLYSLQLASLTLGDGGAAVIVDRAHDGAPGILLAGFTTLAEHSRLCLGLPAARLPGAKMYTRARKIHQVAMTEGPPLIEEVLARGGLVLGDIDWLIPHQTSVRAIRSGERVLARELGCRPRHTAVTVDKYGNTASTTLFVALHELLDEGRVARGDKLLLLSVASGLEIGVVVLAMDELVESHGRVH